MKAADCFVRPALFIQLGKERFRFGTRNIYACQGRGLIDHFNRQLLFWSCCSQSEESPRKKGRANANGRTEGEKFPSARSKTIPIHRERLFGIVGQRPCFPLQL